MAYLCNYSFIRKSTIAPLVCVLALIGCDEGFDFGESLPDFGNLDIGGTTENVETDVIAAEAFSITDIALWDGRPTFGGVWVAHPDAETPERVRIRNVDSGREVIGALYKRERDFPGPRIELSADASAALGVLAGNPTELSIVTLRRQTVEVAVEETIASPVIVAAGANMDTPILRGANDMIADIATDPMPETVILSDVVPEVDADTPSAPLAFLQNLFGPRVPAVDTAPLAIVPVATAIAITPSTAIVASPLSEIVTAPTTEEADRTSVYIQVATMQSESKAEGIASRMERAGLYAEIRERETTNRTLYRVIVGPARTPEALEIMMGVVHEIGYKDAIVLR